MRFNFLNLLLSQFILRQYRITTIFYFFFLVPLRLFLQLFYLNFIHVFEMFAVYRFLGGEGEGRVYGLEVQNVVGEDVVDDLFVLQECTVLFVIRLRP